MFFKLNVYRGFARDTCLKQVDLTLAKMDLSYGKRLHTF